MSETSPKEQAAHARIERTIASAMKLLSGDAAALLPVFVELERIVRLHFSMEETTVLPGYRLHDPEHSAGIEVQHDAMRQELRACRLELEQGRIDRARVEKLLNHYRVHQLNEDTTMYRWARERPADD